MHFKKTNKYTNCIMAATLLTSGIVGVSIPITMNTSNNTNINATTTSQQTGKIIHDSTAQTVNNVNDIIIKSVDMEEYSQAIVSNNGIQEIYVWGRNDFGQLGLGNFENTSIPTKFDMTVFGEYTSIELKFCAIQQFASYALVNTLDGSQKLYTWGSNQFGQLGLGNDNHHSTPQLVSKSDLDDYDQIVKVVPTDFSSSTTYVITVKNNQQKLYGVGANNLGQLGNNTTTNSNKFLPITISGNYKSIEKFHVSYGSCFAIVNNAAAGVTPELQLYVWGFNIYGQLAIGSINNQLTPRLNTTIPFNTSTSLIDFEIGIKGGSGYALNQKTNQLYVWGWNTYGQLGLGDANNRSSPALINSSVFGTNTKIEEVRIVTSVSMGSSYAIINQGNNMKSIYVWGRNTVGQLGLGHINTVYAPVIFPLSRIGTTSDKFSSIKKFEFGKSINSYALVEVDNKLQAYVWGDNSVGQLGDGTVINKSTPVQVKLPINNAEIVDIKCTNISQTKVMIKQNDVLETYVSGNNINGDLGLGHNNFVNTFIRILPIRSLDLSVIPNEYNITASTALDRLNFKTGYQLKTELAKYIDLQALPERANLSIVNSEYDYIKGTLDLTFATNSVYQQFVIDPVYKETEFNFVIYGFKQVKDVDIAPVVVTTVTPTDYNANQLYSALVNSDGEVNRALLAKYVDLTAIPDTAQIHLTRIANQNPTKLDLTLQTNQVYAKYGRTTWTNYNTNLSFSFPQTDWGLIISLSVGAAVIIALIIAGIVIYRKKRLSM